MYQTIFKRYEKKYFLNEAQYQKITEYLLEKAASDKYGKSTVCSIYYDTPNNRLIRTSLQKPIYKEKLRLRCYGKPADNSICFLELKKKYKGVVYKRRIETLYSQGRDFLENKNDCISQSQIKEEINYFRKFYGNLCPAFDIFYDRTAFYEPKNPNIRFTIDSNVLYRDYDLDLTNGIYGKKILQDNTYLLEIKTDGAIPLEFVRLLSELEVYPTSFSKYGTAYSNTIKKEYYYVR